MEGLDTNMNMHMEIESKIKEDLDMDMNMNMDMDIQSKINESKNITKNEDVNIQDNSQVFTNNLTSNPGGLVMTNTANTENNTDNETENETDNEIEQKTEQESNQDSGGGILDVALFGFVLFVVYMYGQRLRKR